MLRFNHGSRILTHLQKYAFNPSIVSSLFAFGYLPLYNRNSFPAIDLSLPSLTTSYCIPWYSSYTSQKAISICPMKSIFFIPDEFFFCRFFFFFILKKFLMKIFILFFPLKNYFFQFFEEYTTKFIY